MRRVVIFLIRKKLGLKKYEIFRFTNQKSNAIYYFTTTNIMKSCNGYTEPSGVSVNWLLDDECEIERIRDYNAR